MKMMKIIHWIGCTAFSEKAIGSKVVLTHIFDGFLRKAIHNHDKEKDDTPGQHYVMLPNDALEAVSSGVAPRSENEEDFVHRMHRGRMTSMMKRDLAAPVESLGVLVFTTEAFLADPDVEEEEDARIRESGATHVIVAVHANAGPKPASYTPYRLVHNLAGGNNDVAAWDMDKVHNVAKETLEFDDAWCVVAD
jgi:hypothetical protein